MIVDQVEKIEYKKRKNYRSEHINFFFSYDDVMWCDEI